MIVEVLKIATVVQPSCPTAMNKTVQVRPRVFQLAEALVPSTATL